MGDLQRLMNYSVEATLRLGQLAKQLSADDLDALINRAAEHALWRWKHTDIITLQDVEAALKDGLR